MKSGLTVWFIGTVLILSTSFHSPTNLTPFEAASGKPVQVTIPVPDKMGGYHDIGTYSIALTNATVGSQIRFTLDGSDPINGQIYTDPLVVSKDSLLRTKAFKSGFPDSNEYQGNYYVGASAPKLKLTLADGTTFYPTGNFTSTLDILQMDLIYQKYASESAVIYYTKTTDGTVPSNPNSSSPVYATSFSLVGDGSQMHIKAYSEVTSPTGWSPSGVSEFVLKVNYSAKYHITYVANGSDGGLTPVDGTAYSTASQATILGSGSLYKNGYAFAGWNDSPAGTGTMYMPGDTKVMNSSLTLYAIWKLGHTLVFHENLPVGQAESGSIPPNALVVIGASQSLPGGPACASYNLVGWNTKGDGTGVSYAVGAAYTMGTQDVDLYGLWLPSYLSYTASGNYITVTGYASPPSSTVLTIPEGITHVGTSAFLDTGITQLTLPSTLISVGPSSFSSCTSLSNIVFPAAGSIDIMNSAFVGCTGLVNLIITPGVNRIEDSAFFNCTNLSNLVFQEGVTFIGTQAFQSSAVSSIALPASLTAFGGMPFSGCWSLVSLSVASSSSSFTSVGNILYSKDMKVLYEAANSVSGALVLAAPLERVCQGAFYGNGAITSLDLPNSLTTVDYIAFYGCSGVHNLTLRSTGALNLSDYCFYGSAITSLTVYAPTPPALGSLVFNPSPLTYVLVPAANLGAYASASGWTAMNLSGF